MTVRAQRDQRRIAKITKQQDRLIWKEIARVKAEQRTNRGWTPEAIDQLRQRLRSEAA